MTVNSREAAWKAANELFPTDYEQDSIATRNAGYPVYWSTLPGCNAWISDLGCRLEVNLENGQSINIWIEEEKEEEEAAEVITEEEVKEMVEASEAAKRISVAPLFTPQVVQVVTLVVSGYCFVSDDEMAVYRAIKKGNTGVVHDLLERYAEANGIKWGSIRFDTPIFCGSKGEEGHYIIRGYIGARIGEEMHFCNDCANLLLKMHEEHKERS